MFAYIGGKYRQSKWIHSFFPKFGIKNYGEVFGGAFWVYVKLKYNFEKAYYNDINRYLVNIFECCKDYKKFLSYLNKSNPQDNLLFEEYRKDVWEYEDKKFDIPNYKLAHEYIYVMTQVFSGIMKENVKMIDLKGKYKSKYIAFMNRVNSKVIQEKLSTIVTSNLNYDKFIEEHNSPDTLLYIDPPYYNTESLYSFHDFGKNDHENLAKILNKTNSKFILSYYDYPQLNEWYPKDKFRWEKKSYAKASMAVKGKKQSKGEELLIMNY